MSRTNGIPTCIFCGIIRGEGNGRLVWSTDETVAFLDRRPLFPGHTLVIPRAHYATLPELPSELVTSLFAAVRLVSMAVEEAMGAEGSFVAMNNRVSQSVPHLHVHVVPRRKHDGLKGFFWPRRNYMDEREMEDVRQAITARLLAYAAGGFDTDRR